MKLTPDHYQQFAFGVDHAAFDEGEWQPQRISTAMMPLYSANDGQITRRMCTAGVGLRFASDTTSIHLAWRTSFAARARYCGSLTIDGGEPIAFGSHDTEGAWSGEIFSEGDGQSHTFEIHLPHTCRADIVSINLDDSANLTTAKPHKNRWLVYGDSITQGMDATLPTNNVISRCARILSFKAHNLGIGGAVIDERLADLVPDIPFDLASIAYGANDFNHNIPAKTFAANTHRLVAALTARNPDAPIVLITPLIWLDNENKPNEVGETMDDLRRSLTPIGEAFAKVRLVDGASLVPGNDAMLPDKVHPSDAGFAAYATNLLSHLQ